MGKHWVDEEIAGCDLGDARLNRRLGFVRKVGSANFAYATAA